MGWQLDREGEHQAGVALGLGLFQHLGIDGLGRVVLHRLGCVLVKQVARAREQELEVVVELRHGAHRAAAGANWIGLVDGDGRWYAFHPVHGRLVHAVQELAGVGRKRLHVAALAFGVEGVEHQTGLARTAGASHNREFAGTNVQVKVFEVVLPCPANADGALGHK